MPHSIRAGVYFEKVKLDKQRIKRDVFDFFSFPLYSPPNFYKLYISLVLDDISSEIITKTRESAATT